MGRAPAGRLMAPTREPPGAHGQRNAECSSALPTRLWRQGSAQTRAIDGDLHPRAFKPGDAATTLVAHLPVTLWQTDDRPTYEFAVARSLAQSFWQWLSTAATEYGLEFAEA